MSDDHPRMTTVEVCALARYGKATLFRRIDAGHMPRPLDRGGGGYLFDRKAVLIALGMNDDAAAVERKSWRVEPDVYQTALSRKVRRR